MTNKILFSFCVLIFSVNVSAVNGFGGNGGIDFCTIIPSPFQDIKPRLQCVSPIGMGLRVDKEMVEQSDSKTSQLSLPLIELTQWHPSELVIKELVKLDGIFKTDTGLLLNIATNNERYDHFFYFPELSRNTEDVEFAWREYHRYLDLSRFLYPYNVSFESSLFGYGYVMTALSDSKTTVLSKYYYALTSRQRALKLIHEGLLRLCLSNSNNNCLFKTLKIEGLIFDFLNGEVEDSQPILRKIYQLSIDV